MRTVSILVSTGPVMLLAAVASAGPVTFTNLDAFLEATDDVREIDFETLPDGSPSVADTLITPDFNYTDQGVTYSSPYPVLAITAPIMGSGFPLSASTPDTTARNWIIADLVTPAYAVGIVFPGTTTLSAFDADMQLIASIGGGRMVPWRGVRCTNRNGGRRSRVFRRVVGVVPLHASP